MAVSVEEDAAGLNVIAELPGGKKKDEVVMLGAHLDSWHAGTGATDNAAGSAVVLEAMRILKALDLPLDRTVRLALWGGEEQGYFGSRAYVREHFADPVTMALKPEHAQLSGYFNLDNGTGKVRGVYLQGNDMMRPLFEAWLAPFRDLGVTTISNRNTGGTDHETFDQVGLPGFQFIQDPLDYEHPHPPLEPGRLRPRRPRRPHPGLGGDGRPASTTRPTGPSACRASPCPGRCLPGASSPRSAQARAAAPSAGGRRCGRSSRSRRARWAGSR